MRFYEILRITPRHPLGYPEYCMPLDYDTLRRLRQHHPAWRLLRAQHAPLIVAFLQRTFVAGDNRARSQSALAEALEDELFFLREQEGETAYPGTALDYLDDWAADDKGWLHKFYPPGSDEPHFDLTPPTEKAIVWLENLTTGRDFVGTESRLQILLDLLRQIRAGSRTDPGQRIAELAKRRDELDNEIAHIRAGALPPMDDTALKERFLQFRQMARELLADFREVENNFRDLGQQTRERITLWDGSKGQLLDEILDAQNSIEHSDQGKSFQGFWDVLMSASQREELDQLLEEALALPVIAALDPDPRLRHVTADWRRAGDRALRTLSRLSEQLRRFLDNRARLENRRIMDILQRIEGHALALRDTPPTGDIMRLDDMAADIELPLEHPLYRPPFKAKIASIVRNAEDADIDAAALYTQIAIDREELAAHIRQDLQQRAQVTLAGVIKRHPLRYGLTELMAYLQVACARPDAVVDENVPETVCWRTETGAERRAVLPRVILTGD